MLYDAHGIFIEGEGHEVLGEVCEEIHGVRDREGLDYLLNEVSGVIAHAQLIKLLIHSCYSVAELFRQGKQSNKGLKSVCALFVAG